MKLKELLEKRAALVAKITDAQKKDKLTTEERSAVEATLAEVSAMDTDIALQQRMDAAARPASLSAAVAGEKRNYSVRNLIMRHLGENVDAGYEMEVNQEAANRTGIRSQAGIILPFERRDTTTLPASAGPTISTNVAQPLPYLYPQTVFSSLGCNEVGGLVGDFEIPYSTTAVQGTGKGETAAAGEITMTFGSLKMTPHRLPVRCDVSRQTLIQNPSMDAFIQREMREGMRAKMEYYGLQGANTSGNPLGLLGYTINSIANSTSFTYANAVTAVNNAFANNAPQAGNYGAVVHPTAAGFIEAKDVSTSTGRFVMQDGKMAGYPYFKTSNAPSTGAGMIIYGNWAEFILGTWGAMELIVDPYSLSDYGLIKLVATAFYDVGTCRPLQFTKTATTISA